MTLITVVHGCVRRSPTPSLKLSRKSYTKEEIPTRSVKSEPPPMGSYAFLLEELEQALTSQALNDNDMIPNSTNFSEYSYPEDLNPMIGVDDSSSTSNLNRALMQIAPVLESSPESCYLTSSSESSTMESPKSPKAPRCGIVPVSPRTAQVEFAEFVRSSAKKSAKNGGSGASHCSVVSSVASSFGSEKSEGGSSMFMCPALPQVEDIADEDAGTASSAVAFSYNVSKWGKDSQGSSGSSHIHEDSGDETTTSEEEKEQQRRRKSSAGRRTCASHISKVSSCGIDQSQSVACTCSGTIVTSSSDIMVPPAPLPKGRAGGPPRTTSTKMKENPWTKAGHTSNALSLKRSFSPSNSRQMNKAFVVPKKKTVVVTEEWVRGVSLGRITVFGSHGEQLRSEGILVVGDDDPITVNMQRLNFHVENYLGQSDANNASSLRRNTYNSPRHSITRTSSVARCTTYNIRNSITKFHGERLTGYNCDSGRDLSEYSHGYTMNVDCCNSISPRRRKTGVPLVNVDLSTPRAPYSWAAADDSINAAYYSRESQYNYFYTMTVSEELGAGACGADAGAAGGYYYSENEQEEETAYHALLVSGYEEDSEACYDDHFGLDPNGSSGPPSEILCSLADGEVVVGKKQQYPSKKKISPASLIDEDALDYPSSRESLVPSGGWMHKKHNKKLLEHVNSITSSVGLAEKKTIKAAGSKTVFVKGQKSSSLPLGKSMSFSREPFAEPSPMNTDGTITTSEYPTSMKCGLYPMGSRFGDPCSSSAPPGLFSSSELRSYDEPKTVWEFEDEEVSC